MPANLLKQLNRTLHYFLEVYLRLCPNEKEYTSKRTDKLEPIEITHWKIFNYQCLNIWQTLNWRNEAWG